MLQLVQMVSQSSHSSDAIDTHEYQSPQEVVSFPATLCNSHFGAIQHSVSLDSSGLEEVVDT